VNRKFDGPLPHAQNSLKSADIGNILALAFEALVVILMFLSMWKDYRIMKHFSPSHTQSLMGVLLQQGELILDTSSEDGN